MVWLQKSFILLSRSWEIGRPLTGSSEMMKLSCVVPASHQSYTSDPFVRLEESTVNVFSSNAIILLKQGKIYMVEEIWWNHLDLKE